MDDKAKLFVLRVLGVAMTGLSFLLMTGLPNLELSSDWKGVGGICMIVTIVVWIRGETNLSSSSSREINDSFKHVKKTGNLGMSTNYYDIKPVDEIFPVNVSEIDKNLLFFADKQKAIKMLADHTARVARMDRLKSDASRVDLSQIDKNQTLVSFPEFPTAPIVRKENPINIIAREYPKRAADLIAKASEYTYSMEVIRESEEKIAEIFKNRPDVSEVEFQVEKLEKGVFSLPKKRIFTVRGKLRNNGKISFKIKNKP